MMNNNRTNIILAVGLILLAATARIVNAEMHLYNLAPLAAIGLFSGAVIKDKRTAFLLAILGQFIADMYFQIFTDIPGFYGTTQLFTYAGLLGAAWLGSYMEKIKPANVLLYLFGASTLFFLVSNFGVWASGLWGTNATGLIKTYAMGIPFFKYTLIGDMIGGVILFSAYYLLQLSFLSKAQKVNA